jgi:biotin carboxyl carrier protein
MSREFVATGLGAEVPVAVTPLADGRCQVAIGERAYEVDARQVRPGTWSLLVSVRGGPSRSHVVDVEAGERELSISTGTIDAAVALEDARRRKLARATAGRSRRRDGGEVIRAPIAGVVVTIAVAAGDEVVPGQLVGVLEAMKMENDLRAERGGAVTAVHAEPGQSVDAGDELVTLASCER